MEPYRPFVDLMTMAVIERHTEIPSDLTPQIKGELLQILTMDCCFQRNRRPLMIALSQTTASLVRCIKDGFEMMQFSVYIRFCGSRQTLEVHKKRIASCVPAKGLVSLLAVTDKQFGDITNYVGKPAKQRIKKMPQQLEFF